MSITYTVKGLGAFLRRVETKSKQARQAVDEELRRASLSIERGAKIKAPVRTSFMRNGIYMEKLGQLRYKVTSPAKYSIYVELGTRKMRPQAFMGPAVKEEAPVLMGNLKKMFVRG